MGGLRIIKEKSVACAFCKLNDVDEIKYGSLYEREGFAAHHFCMLMSNKLPQKGKDHEGIEGFLIKDLKQELIRSKAVLCTFCKKPHASVQCSRPKCDVIFHFPCGLANGSMSQFIGSFKSFCFHHRPKLSIPDEVLVEAKKENTICVICQLPLDFRDETDAIWAKCCHRTWYHRECIQRYALKSGYHFKCAICNNKNIFKRWVEKNGVFIPQQDLLYEIEVEFAEESRPTYKCLAQNCHCPRGRSYVDGDTGWEMVFCRTCGADAMHIVCMELEIRSTDLWECNSCKNVGMRIKSQNIQDAENTPTSSSIQSLSSYLHQQMEGDSIRIRKRKREDVVSESGCANKRIPTEGTNRSRKLRDRLKSHKKKVDSENNGDLPMPKRRKEEICTNEIEGALDNLNHLPRLENSQILLKKPIVRLKRLNIGESHVSLTDLKVSVPAGEESPNEEHLFQVEDVDSSEPSRSSCSHHTDSPTGTDEPLEHSGEETDNVPEPCEKTDSNTEVLVVSDDDEPSDSEPEVITEKTAVHRLRMVDHPTVGDKRAMNLAVTVAVRIPKRANFSAGRSSTDGAGLDITSTVQESVTKMIVKTLGEISSRVPVVEKSSNSSSRRRFFVPNNGGTTGSSNGERLRTELTRGKISLSFKNIGELNEKLNRIEEELNQLIDDCSIKSKKRWRRTNRRPPMEGLGEESLPADKDVEIVEVIRSGTQKLVQIGTRTSQCIDLEEDEIIDVE